MPSQKDFTDWFKLKPKLQVTNSSKKFFKEREIWWASLGVNIGDEEDGKNEKFNRPVLILKKFNKNLFWAVPLTTQIKNNMYYVNFSFKNKNISAMISQLKSMDVKRISTRMGTLNQNDFQKICNSIKSLL